MKIKTLLAMAAMMVSLAAFAEEDTPYIEVTGTSEIEIVPDEIHYVIEIKEYFKEEFDQHAKPEDYRTKIPLSQIEEQLRKALSMSGIPYTSIRTEEVGDTWRKEGRDFLISKTFDVTLNDFRQIDDILKNIDTKGINSMRIGQLKNKDILKYHEQGKILALQAAKAKAQCLVESLGRNLGQVLRIVEQTSGPYPFALAQSNVMSSDADNYDSFRVIKRSYSILVRFAIE